MSEPQTMSKDELLNKIREGKAEFDRQIAGLSDAQMLVPGPHGDEWTMKDVLAHLTACMLSMSSRLPGQQRIPFPVEAHEGESWPDQMQRINDYYYAQFKDKPLAEVKADFEAAYQHTLAAVEALSDAQLVGEDKAGLGQGDDSYDREVRENIPDMVAGDTYEHFNEHLGFMADWLARQRTGDEDHPFPVPSRDQMVEMMKQGHDKLVKALSGLSDQQMTTPGAYPENDWTLKDTLAHLAEWMRATPPRLPGGSGKAFPIEKGADEDYEDFTNRVNAYWHEQDRDMALDRAWAEFEDSFKQLVKTVERLSEVAAADRDTMYRIAGNSFAHFDEHLEWVGPWVKQQKGEA